MSYVDAKTWFYMRETLPLFMDDVVSIYSITESFDRYGNVTRTRTLVGTPTVQISSPNGNEQKLIAALVTTGVENTESIKITYDYQTSGFAINNEVDTADGKTWNIIFVDSSFTFTAANVALLYRSVVSNRNDK